MNNVSFPYPKFRWTRCFITRVASISYHSSRNFPDCRKRYTVFVGRSFWRLVMFVYATSVHSWTAASDLAAPGAEARGLQPDAGPAEPVPMNAVITGVRGSGKSHLMMTAAAFLTARNTTDLYKIICIGDCRSWIHSDNPVAFFTLELMLAFENSAKTKGAALGHDAPAPTPPSAPRRSLAEGNYAPPRVFTDFDELKAWLEAVGRRIAEFDDLRLVIFIDQLEEVYSLISTTSNANALLIARLVDLLIALKFPILIVSFIPINLALPPVFRDRKVFAEMKMPASITYTDFDMFVELFECSRRLSDEDDSLLHDLRYWSGAIPAQVTKFFTSTTLTDGTPAPPASNRGLNSYDGPNCVASRLVRYRAERAKAFQDLVISAASKLERLPRMHLLLQIFRMLLHIPTDDPNISAPATATGLESLFIPAALQKFFHPVEGIIAYRHVPTAVTPAAFYAMADERFLARMAPKWTQVLEALVASIMNSKAVCTESKRRVVRFYAQLRLIQMSVDEPLYDKHHPPIPGKLLKLSFAGTTQFNDPFSITLDGLVHLRRVAFAGLSPTPCLIPSVAKTLSALPASSPILFIPGRTDYPFFDFLVAMPAERSLYAVSTIPYALASKHCASSINTATNTPLNPLTLLEMWSKDMKDAGYARFTTKYCHIPPLDLLAQLGSAYQPKAE